MGSVIVRGSDGNCSVAETYNALLNSALYDTSRHVEISGFTGTIDVDDPDSEADSVYVPDKETIERAVDNVVLLGYPQQQQISCSVCMVNVAQFRYYPCRCKCICGPCLQTFIVKTPECLYTCPACSQQSTTSIA